MEDRIFTQFQELGTTKTSGVTIMGLKGGNGAERIDFTGLSTNAIDGIMKLIKEETDKAHEDIIIAGEDAHAKLRADLSNTFGSQLVTVELSLHKDINALILKERKRLNTMIILAVIISVVVNVVILSIFNH